MKDAGVLHNVARCTGDLKGTPLQAQVEALDTTHKAREKWTAWYGTAADQLARNKTYFTVPGAL